MTTLHDLQRFGTSKQIIQNCIIWNIKILKNITSKKINFSQLIFVVEGFNETDITQGHLDCKH